MLAVNLSLIISVIMGIVSCAISFTMSSGRAPRLLPRRPEPKAITVRQAAMTPVPVVETPRIVLPEREDTSWIDIVGIPLDTWVGKANMDLTFPPSAVFEPGVLTDLEKRRAAGEFVLQAKMIEAVKKPLAIEPPKPKVKAKTRPLSETKTTVSISDITDGFSVEPTMMHGWVTQHEAHGIDWRRDQGKFGDSLHASCAKCEQTWIHDFVLNGDQLVNTKVKRRDLPDFEQVELYRKMTKASGIVKGLGWHDEDEENFL